MVILALDLSKTDCGFCVFDTKTHEFIDYGNIRTKKYKTNYDKMSILFNTIAGIIKMRNVDIVVSENINRCPSQEYLLDLHKIIGGIIRICDELDVRYEYELPKNFWIDEVAPKKGKFSKLDATRIIARKYINIGDVYRTNKKKNDCIYYAIGIALGYSIKEGLI